MTKLFILGNGFDLTLGLNSKYIDFYNACVLAYKNNYSKISFWELLLGDTDKNWIDIETEIEKMLIEINSENALNLTLKEIIDKINYIVEQNYDDIIKNKDIDINMIYKKNLLSKRKEITEFLNYFIENNNEKIIFSDFLSEQLVLLQQNFNNYMNRELEKFNFKTKFFSDEYPFNSFISTNYNNTALNLLSNLNESNDFNDTSVLNFNYTNFNNKNDNHKYYGNINMLNIHGKLNNNIIIGSDLKIINQGNELIPFTKPFKIVNNVNKISNGNLSNFGILKHSNNIDHIIFFGHSLGDTDFNYFKSIFDAVNLYKGKVDLTFYVSIYNPNKKMEIISEHEAKILNLLTKYSKTLDNIKEDDVSLFTKLLLEGRLNIKNLDYLTYKRYNLNLYEELTRKKEVRIKTSEKLTRKKEKLRIKTSEELNSKEEKINPYKL